MPIKQDQNISLKLHKRGSTDYFLTVNASKPYTLAFTEFYDPFWVARAKTNGEYTEYKSSPLYFAMNGFWINKVGKYDLEITYKPQELLYIGGYISIITLLVSLGFLLFLWGRKKMQQKREINPKKLF